MMPTHNVRSAGLTGGIVDHFVESKGVSCGLAAAFSPDLIQCNFFQLDAIDKAKAKHDAKKKAEEALANSGDY